MTTRNSLQPTSIEVKVKPAPITCACSFSAAASVLGLPNTTSGPVVYSGSPPHAPTLFGDADDVPENATSAAAPTATATIGTILTGGTPTMPAGAKGSFLTRSSKSAPGQAASPSF